VKEHWEQHSFLDAPAPVSEKTHQKRQKSARRLREAIEPYISIPKLRQRVSEQTRLEEALRTGDIPEEVSWLLSLFAAMIAPIERDEVKSPSDIAGHLQVKIGHLCQEQFCVVCLNTKHRVQKIHTVYQGTVDTASIRVAEVYREPVKLNSAGVIFAHNHPSSDPTPSPEDILITRELVSAGKLLQIEPLDHLVITRDQWVSFRALGLWPDS